jgi:hypothetical protein
VGRITEESNVAIYPCGYVEEHLQTAAVHRILRPLVAGEQAARLRVHRSAVQPDEHHSLVCSPMVSSCSGPIPSSYSSRTAFGCRVIPTPSGLRCCTD